jgi:predicted RNase H-like nuclease (RuvC/YqgF family)
VLNRVSSPGDSILQQLHEVQNLTRELEKLKARLGEVEAELVELSDHMATHAKVKDQLELKTREIDLLTQRIQRTSYFQLQKQVCVQMILVF